MVCVFKQQMLYFIGAKTESQIGQKWPKMYPGTLKILKFPGEGTPDPPPPQWEGAPPSYTYPDLTLRAKIDGGSATIVSPCY